MSNAIWAQKYNDRATAHPFNGHILLNDLFIRTFTVSLYFVRAHEMAVVKK